MKLHIKSRKFILTALIIGPMTFLMACVGVLKHDGLINGCVVKIFVTWTTMFPIAYLAALMIIPAANKVISKINFIEQ